MGKCELHANPTWAVHPSDERAIVEYLCGQTSPAEAWAACRYEHARQSKVLRRLADYHRTGDANGYVRRHSDYVWQIIEEELGLEEYPGPLALSELWLAAATVAVVLLLAGIYPATAWRPSRAQDTKMIDPRAQTIAKGDVSAIMADYAAEPVLHWIGGPLAGEYKGSDAIKGVWTKFTTAQAPLTVKVTNPHGMGADTLMADTVFTGAKANAIPVILTEKAVGGKIKEETWKVNAPAPAAGSAATPTAATWPAPKSNH